MNYKLKIQIMRKSVFITLAIVVTAAINSLAVAIAGDTNIGSHSISIEIPEVALLDLEGTTAITLSPTSPTEAGAPFDFSSAVSNSVWVNYSSIVIAGKSRMVTASITSGSVPSGLNLNVVAGTYTGTGNGTMGNPSVKVTLSNTAQKVITGIGSCYTDNGSGNGHNLTYELELISDDKYNQLVEGNTSVTITYTLTDDN